MINYLFAIPHYLPRSIFLGGNLLIFFLISAVFEVQAQFANPPVPVMAPTPAASTTIDRAQGLAGIFDVSAGGQATYTIPIVTAPGSGGMVPAVSLSYNSDSMNGEVGIGWSLNTSGSISRCRQTESQDKRVAPISWSSHDRFCLNGERLLVEASDTYGAPGSQYKTEIDRFARITALGGRSGQPDYFKVEHKDGRVDFYGPSEAEQYSQYKLSADKILSWMLTKSQDSAGHKIKYNYSASNVGEKPLIESIFYAYGNTEDPAAKITFEWQSRIDVNRGYLGGLPYSSSKILLAVESWNNDVSIRKYNMEYEGGNTARDPFSRLVYIEECVNFFCRNPTTFDWIVAEPPSFNAGGVSLSSSFPYVPSFFGHEFGDINGDGLKDLVWVETDTTTVPYTKRINYAIAVRETNGHINYVKQDFESGGVIDLNYNHQTMDPPQIAFIDYNGDGRQDLVVKEDWFNHRIRIFLSKPQSDGSWKFSHLPVHSFPTVVGLFTIADMNGDGFPDLVNGNSVRYLKGNGQGFHDPISFTVVTPPALISGNCSRNIWRWRHETGDFNGDGKVDLIAIACVPAVNPNEVRYEHHVYTSEIGANGGIELRFYSKFGVDYSSKPVSLENCDHNEPEGQFSYAGKIRVIDINNDGLSDIVGDPIACLSSEYHLSTGTGFIAAQSPPFRVWSQGTVYDDINGDGYIDYVHFVANEGLYIYYWTPYLNGFSPQFQFISEPNSDLAAAGARFMDINGDGMADYIRIGVKNRFSVQLNNINYQATRKITDIYGGVGQIISIDYQPITKTKHYGRITGINASGTTENICEPTDLGNHCWSRSRAASNHSQFYQQINNPFGQFPSDSQSLDNSSYAIFENFSPIYVVTSISKLSPKANLANPGNVSINAKESVKYYYEGSRTQSGGRGFLGFKKITTVNASGLRKDVEYRQDWPFVGQVVKTETYNQIGMFKRTENSWALSNCFNNQTEIPGCTDSLDTVLRQQGGRAIGSVRPFLKKSKTTNYHLNTEGVIGNLSNVVEIQRLNDDKGNTIYEKISTGIGGSPLHIVETTNEHDYLTNSYSMSMGRLAFKTVVTSQYGDLGSDVITRESSFGYYTSGVTTGLLAYEIIEPNQPSFTVRTDHYYDTLGLRIYSQTTADELTRRSARVEYDARGRYVDKTYEYFNSTSNPKVGVQRLTSTVISRDKYGNPTNLRQNLNYQATGTPKILTSITATTPFGTLYFTADSTGTFTTLNAGLGQGAGSVCPATTKIWKETTQAGGGVSRQCFDIVGRVIREATGGFLTGQWSVVDYEYHLDRLIHKSEPRFLTDSPRWTSNLDLDALGRPARILGPLRQQDNIRPESLVMYENEFTYFTNPNDDVRVEEKNILGQVVSVRDPNNGFTRFSYDARGNLLTMHDPAGNTTAMTYDLRDRKTSINDPDKGEWFFEYNRFNEVICQKDAKNQTVTFEYDVRGRTIKQISRSASLACISGAIDDIAEWYYDSDGGYGALGKISSTKVTHSDGSVYRKSFSYDSFGRANLITIAPNNAHVYWQHTHRDQFGRVFRVWDEEELDGESYHRVSLQNFYSSTGYLNEIRDARIINGQQKLYYKINNHDARGNVISAIFGNQTNFSAEYYKDSGLAKTLSTTSVIGAISLQYLDLSWDQVGNLQSRHELGGGTWIEQYLRSRDIREDFQYDSLNRLHNWTTSGDFAASETVTYNSIDNIVNKSGTGTYNYGNQCTHASNAGPHAACRVGTTNFIYDNNGNLTSDSAGRILQYSVLDQLSAVTKGSHTTQFKYDSSGERYKRIDKLGTAITTTIYLGDVEKIVYPDGTMEWMRRIAGVALVTIKSDSIGVEQSRKISYLHHDHLGSTSMITDDNGYVVKDFYYDPWGATREPNTNITNWISAAPFIKATKPLISRGFTGHEHLDEVGLVHMNGRIYDAKLARFVQADPIIQDPLKIQSLNRYSYVWNNPLNSTDPSGFRAKGAAEADEWAEALLGKTPDMELDDSLDRASRFNPDEEAAVELLARQWSAGLSENAASNSASNVSIEEIGLSAPQTTQTNTGNYSAASSEAKNDDSSNRNRRGTGISEEADILVIGIVGATALKANRDKREPGGLVFTKTDGKYGLTQSEPDDIRSSVNPWLSIDQVPVGATVVGLWHYHYLGMHPVHSGADIQEANELEELKEFRGRYVNLKGVYTGGADGNVYYYAVGTYDYPTDILQGLPPTQAQLRDHTIIVGSWK